VIRSLGCCASWRSAAVTLQSRNRLSWNGRNGRGRSWWGEREWGIGGTRADLFMPEKKSGKDRGFALFAARTRMKRQHRAVR
jgi:hypothetical protein